MQNTSNITNWDTITSGEHWFETKLDIDNVGTFDESKLFEVTTSHKMFANTPTVGKAISGEIKVKMLFPSVDIPEMACMRLYVRACNSTTQSGWLPQGVFYIDTRERTKDDTGMSFLTIHGYDAMLKTEQIYNGRITGDSTDIQMVAEIAYQIGISVDSRTNTLMTAAYTIPLPTGYTYRQVLAYIAGMYAGTFIITDDGKLRLVTLYELPPETNYLIDHVGNWITFGVDGEASTATYSGSIATFNGTTDDTISSITGQIEPVQDLHGYDNPWVGGAGINKIGTLTAGTYNDVILTNNGDGSYTLNGTASALTEIAFDNFTALESGSYYMQLFNPTTATNSRVQPKNGRSAITTAMSFSTANQAGTFTAANGITSVTLVLLSGASFSDFKFSPMLEVGTTGHPFAPHENICPITGWTGANVWDDPKYAGNIWWNQLVRNPDLTQGSNGLRYWYTTNLSAQNQNNGVVALTVTAVHASQSYYNLFRQSLATNTTENHKFLVIYDYMPTYTHNAGMFLIRVSGASGNYGGQGTSATAGQWNTVAWFVPSANKVYGTLQLALNTTTASGYSGGEVEYLRNPQMFDLTEMFGSGNEPTTLEQFRAMFPKANYAYNSGEKTTVNAVSNLPYSHKQITWQTEAGTVYGGYYTVNEDGSVDLVGEYVKKTITAFSGAFGAANNGYGVYVTLSDTNHATSLIDSSRMVSNYFKYSSAGYNSAPLYSYGCNSGANTTQSFVLPSTITSKAEADAWLSSLSTPLECTFRLTTPINYTLADISMLPTLNGVNNVWTDTGDISVTVDTPATEACRILV